MIFFKVGDIIEVPSTSLDRCTNLYLVRAICLGGVGQASGVHLTTIDQLTPRGVSGETEFFVPVSILEAAMNSLTSAQAGKGGETK